MTVNKFKNAIIPVVEIFNSVSGEGISAGSIATFVRVAGCNLRCSYCDTTYSYDEYNEDNQMMTPDEIVDRVAALGCKDIICTGGEPLELQKPKRYLPLYLASKGFRVRIETNGSCPVYSSEELECFLRGKRLPVLYYALDIKCPGSGMSKYNLFEQNLEKLYEGDELKFVVSHRQDIDYAVKIIEKYKDILALNKVIINFSPVFGRIEPRELVEVLKEKHQYFSNYSLQVRLSLQIHKIIWPADTKGV